MSRIDVAVLGRPHVTLDDVPAPLVGRLLELAVRLAIAGQSPVPLHRLADVWPDSAASDGAIRVALTRLRRALGPNTITRVEHGYLMTPSAHIDADRFEHLLIRARDVSLDPQARLAAVDEGLRLWHGAAYEGFEASPWVRYEAIRLDELREHALDLRFELLVEHGAHEEVVGELAAALERTPERDRRSELLALALYRSGRQTSALDVIDRTRRRLREEYGLHLGDSLGQLERQILEHDPSLSSASSDDDEPPRDARLRSATALMREGMVDDAVTISGEALATARSDGNRRRLADALLVRAQAVTLAGTADADELIDEAQTIGRSLGDGRLLARAALIRFGAGVPPDRTKAMIELAEPLDLLPSTAAERVELLCAAAVVVTFVDLDMAADRVLVAARRTYEAVGDVRSEVVWLAARSIVGSVRGDDMDTADELAERAAVRAASTDDPLVATLVLHAGLRRASSRGDLGLVDRLVDELAVAAQRAVLPFGIVRVHLCRITNALARGDLESVPGLIEDAAAAGRRLNTHAADGAAESQRLAFALEEDRLGEQLGMLRTFARSSPTAGPAPLAAYVGDESDRERLRRHLGDVRHDASFPIVLALVALVAGRHRDAVAGGWARPHLAALGDRTIFVGFGTLGLGFARFFLGLTEFAVGEYRTATASFEAAALASEHSGAHLWAAHARLWSAEALLDIGGSAAEIEARRAIDLAVATGVVGNSRRAQEHLHRLGGRLDDASLLDASRGR